MVSAAFDDAALAKLTAKIEGKLTQGGPKPQAVEAPAHNHKGQQKQQQQKQQQKQRQQINKRPNPSNDRPFDKKRKQFSDPSSTQSPSSANKRSRQDGHGNHKKTQSAIASEHRNSATNKQTDVVKSAPQDAKHVLLEEIMALGGDQADFDLIGGENSDNEATIEGSKDNDKALRAELAQFAATLGFDKVEQAPDDDEVEEAAAKEDEENEAGSEASQDHDEEDDEDEAEDEEMDIASGLKQKATQEQVPKAPKGPTIFEQRADWHAVELPPLPSASTIDLSSFSTTIANLKAHADSLLQKDTQVYNKSQSASSTHKFMSTIMTSGTMSDKVSALTLAAQESPVHNVKTLENLLVLAQKRNRGQALAALAALVDMLGPGMILPSDRRLYTFASQPGLTGSLNKKTNKKWTTDLPLPSGITEEHLISWAFEDWLKESYFKMIQALEVWCDDEIDYSRTKAVDMVYALLKDKPEQESNLLRLLVNKLGDRERKISSRASYLILQLLNIHPAMKSIVIKSVEQDIIFRTGQDMRAKYTAINTLNQTILSSKEPAVADSLLKIYFGLFVSLLKTGALSSLDGEDSKPAPKKSMKRKRAPSGPKRDKQTEAQTAAAQDAASKLVSAILTGVNRAVPFSQADSSTLEAHLDTLFRITHSSNFNTSIQALMLVQQLSATRHLATERFYRTLYEALLDPRLITSSKQSLFLNLLYRSLKADVDVRRVKAFVKRMLQILNLHQPSFVCGILYLIIELCVTFPDLKTLLNEPEEHDSEETNGATAEDGLDNTHKPDTMYDGRKRDPEYSNAHRSCLWELMPFLQHYHPSVDVYATDLLSGQQTTGKPELASHSLINFLDKFVYRNAKVSDTARGASIMQPVHAGSGAPNKNAGTSINSAAFWNKKSEDVAVEDVFFHEYFSKVGKPGSDKKTKKSKDEDSDAGSGDEEGQGSDAGEDEIWQALVNSRPDVEGDDDSEEESDTEFNDLMGLEDSDEDMDDAEDVEDGGDQEDGESDGLEGLLDDEDDDEDDDDAMFSDEEDEAEEEKAEEKAKPKGPLSAARERKKKLKALPMFASVDDYADMLAEEEDGM